MRARSTLGAVSHRPTALRDWELVVVRTKHVAIVVLSDSANRDLVVQALRRHVAGAERFGVVTDDDGAGGEAEHPAVQAAMAEFQGEWWRFGRAEEPASEGLPGTQMKEAQRLQQQMAALQEEVPAQGPGDGRRRHGDRRRQRQARDRRDQDRSRGDDKDDVQMLEDLVLAACNEALRKSRELVQQELGKLTGGLKIPGLGM